MLTATGRWIGIAAAAILANAILAISLFRMRKESGGPRNRTRNGYPRSSESAAGLPSIRASAEASSAHKETAHYSKWRDTVARMMAEPRQSVKFANIDPTDMQ
jgi:hypothetical protein